MILTHIYGEQSVVTMVQVTWDHHTDSSTDMLTFSKSNQWNDETLDQIFLEGDLIFVTDLQ